jgi:hypothetical protein
LTDEHRSPDQPLGEDRFTPEEKAEMNRAAALVSKLAFRQLHREAERGGRVGMFYAGVMCAIVGHIAAHLGPEIAAQLFHEVSEAIGADGQAGAGLH